MGLAGGKGGSNRELLGLDSVDSKLPITCAVSGDAFAKLTSIKQKHNKNFSPKILFAIPHLVFKIHRR